MITIKKRRVGKKIEEIEVGESLQLVEKIEDKDLLLYLGLTNDANPLYLQHDYAAQTAFERPIVPTILLTGIVTAAISKYLPGPGSYITEQQLQFPAQVYHEETIELHLQVVEVQHQNHLVTIQVHALNEQTLPVMTGTVKVVPQKVTSE